MGGMGFLLVFFHHPPEDEPFDKKKPLFSPLKSHSNNRLLSKLTQSTLSICGVLLFTTLLLFTLSSFEPASTSGLNTHRHRRLLRQIPQATPARPFFVSRFFAANGEGSSGNFPAALQGMGALYSRGTKAMTDLVVGHVAEDAQEREIGTFIRLVYHSGLLSRSDLVLIFDSPASAVRFGRVVKSECDSFLRLVRLNRELDVSSNSTGRGSGLTRYLREVGEDDKEAVWGRRRNSSSTTQLSQASYGSVIGFESSELDPENALSGFMDRVPMSLRRWACYPMLLGRIRRHFKHTMLLDVSNLLILSDPFTRARNRSTELIFTFSSSETESTRHNRRNSGKSHGHERVNSVDPRVILGGSRGIRRFAKTALMEIVRVVVERKGRNSVSESGLVSELVHKGHLLMKNVNVVSLGESIPEAGALVGFNTVDSTGSGLLAFSEYFSVVQRRRGSISGNDIDIDSVIRKQICFNYSDFYSSVYTDCLATQ